MNFSTGNLKKLEALFKELGYMLRYEKGNFNSGYCLIKDKKVVIVNKYFTDDVKFQKLLDIIQTLDIQKIDSLSEPSAKLLEKLLPTKVFENEIPFEDGQ